MPKPEERPILPRTREIMMETCDTMGDHVAHNKNWHGPAVLKAGELIPTHDKVSHKRELDFWADRRAMYAARPVKE